MSDSTRLFRPLNITKNEPIPIQARAVSDSSKPANFLKEGQQSCKVQREICEQGLSGDENIGGESDFVNVTLGYN